MIAGAVLGGGARDRVPGLFIRRSFAGFVVFTAARIALDAATGT